MALVGVRAHSAKRARWLPQTATLTTAAPPWLAPATALQTHLPGYVADFDKLKEAGAEVIVCVAVNDAFVMGAWGEAHGAPGKVRRGWGQLTARGARRGYLPGACASVHFFSGLCSERGSAGLASQGPAPRQGPPPPWTPPSSTHLRPAPPQVRMLADTNGELTRALDIELPAFKDVLGRVPMRRWVPPAQRVAAAFFHPWGFSPEKASFPWRKGRGWACCAALSLTPPQQPVTHTHVHTRRRITSHPRTLPTPAGAKLLCGGGGWRGQDIQPGGGRRADLQPGQPDHRAAQAVSRPHPCSPPAPASPHRESPPAPPAPVVLRSCIAHCVGPCAAVWQRQVTYGTCARLAMHMCTRCSCLHAMGS